MFTVTAAAGQGLELELGNTSSLLDIDATITAFTTEWSIDGTNWTPGNTVPSVPASGVVFVRANITSEADETFENSEAFTLSATYTTGGRLSATGIANIVDNGSGSLFDGTFTSGQPGLVNAPLDNDRAELSLPDVTVNEASPYVVFQIAGTTGQAFTLALADGGIGFNDTNDDINKQGSQRAVAGFDYQNQLEVYNGENWISYRPGTPVTIPSGGSLLLVRVPLINDTVYESVHAFTLTATPPTGSPASGRALIGDFGTGLIFNDSGAEDRNAAKDDDRQLKVDSPIVNEGSEHVVFRVTGITSPVELALQDLGIGTGFTTLTDPNLQYWTGTAWAPYVGTGLSAGTHFPAGGELFVRVAIGEEQDTIREGSERFTLRVNGAGGPSLGTATIRDDGTGAIWLGNSLVPATPSELSAAGTVPDDDFDRDGIIPTTEEALATLAASQGFGAAAGDINGDGLSDALQNALATLAWRDVESFKQGNEGTLTDVKPIIALAALADASGSAVSSTLQLQDIRVLDYADPSEFGSATSAVTVDPETGERTVTLINGATVTTPWDSLRFKLAPQDPSGSFTDLNPSRDGVQVRLFIDIRAADLDASAFNGYIKFISQATIDAAGPAGRRDLDGNLITTAGWIDFTQRTPGGDGARFVIDANNKITGIELILTDNSVGDNDLRTNFIFDPGVPIQINDVRLVPTSDRKGLEVVGLPGQRLWADFSAVLADATLQNGYNLVRISPTGEQSPIGAIGATSASAFLGDTRVQLHVGDVVRFTQVSGSRTANSTPNLVVTGSEDCLIIRLEDGGATDNDSNDLVIKVNASSEDPHPESTRMARYQLASDQAYIDLSWISAAGINLKLDVKTQAGQENTLGLVRIDTDSSTGHPLGTVGGLAPSAGASFDAAVRANLLSFRQTQSGDQTISGLDLTLQGFEAGIYAPALITPQGRVYTYGLSSSSDRKQHIRVLGANSFGFEDKGDRDFNDVVLTFEVAEREAPSLELTSDGRALTVVAGTGDAKGLWLDLNAVIADARWQNSFDLIKRLASGQEETVGSVGASRGGAFLGSKQLFLAIGETLRFQQNSNDNPINSDPALRITKTGERYRVALDDSGNGGIGANADFNDLIIDIDSSTLEPCTDVVKLARQQLTSADGILDLTDIGAEGLRLDLSVLTDSGKSNTLSFVKLDVDPVTGKPLKQVAGVHANADQAFRQAVRDNLIDFSLRAGGRSSQSAVWELDASDSGYYAAVLVTSDGHLFTFGDSTGADGKQHLKLLGDNSFGFEDRLTRQGADWDYNDLTVKITPL